MTARRPQKADWGRMDTSDVTESERSETQYKARPTTLATSLPPLFHLQLTREEGLLFGQYPRNFPSPSRTNNLTRNQNGGTLPRDCRREPQEKLRTKGGEFRVPTSSKRVFVYQATGAEMVNGEDPTAFRDGLLFGESHIIGVVHRMTLQW